MYQCSFNPVDPSMCAVCGKDIFRFFRLQENMFKGLSTQSKRETQDYLCHTWLANDDRVVVGTDNGELLLYEAGTFVDVLKESPGEGSAVAAVTFFSKGFVAAGDEGTLMVFERSEEPGEYYRRTKLFALEGGNNVQVTNLSVSPSEESLVCSTSTHQMYARSICVPYNARARLARVHSRTFSSCVSAAIASRCPTLTF